jgi:hypothetical protein
MLKYVVIILSEQYRFSISAPIPIRVQAVHSEAAVYTISEPT